LLVVAAIGVLVALAVADALRSDHSSAPATAPSTTTQPRELTLIEAPPRGLPARVEIEWIGNHWAPLFAAGRTNTCRYMTDALCGRLACEDGGGQKIRNCTPPTAFQQSFEGATVQDIWVKGFRAVALFSNGEWVAFHGDGGTWSVQELGERASRTYLGPPSRREIERIGNEWASLFAASSRGCRAMSQPLCGRIVCERPGGFKIMNCKPPSDAFRKSFEGATVEDIVIKRDRAAARFSNGEVVELGRVIDGWLVSKLGGKAGRGFFE
jgi:hypothetical protein